MSSRDSIDLVIVAADPSSLSSELENVKGSNGVAELLMQLVASSDARVKSFPLPFPNVINANLVPFFSHGVLYSTGFHCDSTVSMVVIAETGGIVHVDVPKTITQFAPGFTNEDLDETEKTSD